jgi:alanine racemase
MMMSPDAIATLALDRAWVEIDPTSLTHNIQVLQALLKPETMLMAVIKADGYGHGAPQVAKWAEYLGVHYFGVATVPEGIELREAGITQPIMILGAAQSRNQVEAIAHWQLEPTLCTPAQAMLFSKVLSEALPVHLKIDTGMSRLGHPWQDAENFIKLVQELPRLDIASIYSHLATADDPDPTFMKEQQARFEGVMERSYPEGTPIPPLHLANSAGTLFSPEFHYDMVRVGLSLYGIYPGPQFQSVVHLKPVMQVRARITQIKDLEAGMGVSYNHRFVAPTDLKIAIVAIGYADGVPRTLSHRMEVLIRGQRVRQLGTITMDQIMIDVSELNDIQVGEVVTLLGQDGNGVILADEWAELAGTIPYEIVCGFQRRLPRMEKSKP